MDLGTILVRQNNLGNGTGQPQLDDSGDYILPVPFSALQHQLLNAIISSHYSELLAYFSDEDTKEQARTERAIMSLEQMAQNIHRVCVHPALLLAQYMPNNLLARDAPNVLARNSGTFQALGKIIKLISELGIHVGIVASPGKTTDLLEAFIGDKQVNCYRYSGTPLRDIRPQRRNISTVYLVPSRLQYLTAAVNSAFDLIITLDNSFELESDYAAGLRYQLRDPLVRKPMAPILHLLPLNTVLHAQVSNPNVGIEALAAAVVLSAQAGKIPEELVPLYEENLVSLVGWFKQPDTPWPLPRTNQLGVVTHRQVYETLMQTPGVQVFQDDDNTTVETSDGNKRIKLEDNRDDLTVKLIETNDKLVKNLSTLQKELESYRAVASGRENALDSARDEILQLTIKERTRVDNKEATDARIKRYKTELELAKERISELQTKIQDIETAATASDSESSFAKYVAATKLAENQKAEIASYQSKLASQESMVEYLKNELASAAKTVGELHMQINEAKSEAEVQKQHADGKFVLFRQAGAEKELQAKDERIALLEAELANARDLIDNYEQTNEPRRGGRARNANSGRAGTRSANGSGMSSPQI